MDITLRRKYFSILSGLLTSTVCGMLLYSFSVLIKPIKLHFGWSYVEISFAFSICYFVSSFLCFPSGKLITLLGARQVSILGSFLVSFGFMMCAFMESKLAFYVFYGVVAGSGCAFLYMTPLHTIPGWWSERHISLTGFAVVGLGLGSIFMGPFATWIIKCWSLQHVFLICSIIMFLLSFMASLLITNPPIHKNEEDKIVRTTSLIKDTYFWLLYAGNFLAISPSIMFISHLASYTSDFNYSSYASGYFISIFSVANTLSRLISGLIAEKIGVFKCSTITIFLQGYVMAVIYFISNSAIALCMAIFVIGWSLGTLAALFPSMSSALFGKKNNTSNYGLILTASSLAGVIGPMLGGWLKDTTDVYLPSFILGSSCSLCSAFIIAYISKHKSLY